MTDEEEEAHIALSSGEEDMALPFLCFLHKTPFSVRQRISGFLRTREVISIFLSFCFAYLKGSSVEP